MKRIPVTSGLEAVVTIGLNCIDYGIDTRENVKESILSYVTTHYLPLAPGIRLEELPLEVLDALHRVCGVDFEANDGRVGRIALTPAEKEAV